MVKPMIHILQNKKLWYVLTVVLRVWRVVGVEVVLVAEAVSQLGLAVPQLRGHLARAPVRRGPGQWIHVCRSAQQC